MMELILIVLFLHDVILWILPVFASIVALIVLLYFAVFLIMIPLWYTNPKKGPKP